MLTKTLFKVSIYFNDLTENYIKYIILKLQKQKMSQ